MLLPVTSKINNEGKIVIGGVDVTELKARFGTPLYIMDIATIKKQCRDYVNFFKFPDLQCEVIYASKAFCTLPMCQLAISEGLSIDVSTGGELYIALKSGFSGDKIFFHGNNKSESEMKFGLENKVNIFIVDNFTELDRLNELCGKKGIMQKIMLRIAPGIKAHTHKYIQTGGVDSKFGFGIHKGIAVQAVKRALEKKNLELIGLHAHIGSQIFNIEVYEKLIDIMLDFMSNLNKKFDINLTQLNIGGGLGIKYTVQERPAAIADLSRTVYQSVKKYSQKYGVKLEKIYLEPGRSIVGNAGATLYEIGNIKEIPGVKNFISIDGGMSDNIRPILYQARYDAFIANKASYIGKIENGDIVSNADTIFSENDPDIPDKKKYTIVGKHCESGDVIIEDIVMPAVKAGDLLLVSSTGAYCYSMSSNYNSQPKSAVVAVEDGKSWLWVERQSYEDLIIKDRKLYE
ncbi:MAG: diaminopimelate decarboxylase [Actinobacteria bacterium]|nr:diaminopimelate decarboxylase [Actinomycetota bacterium]